MAASLRSMRGGCPCSMSVSAVSFGQPRFAKALNQLLRVLLSASGDPPRNCKVGIDRKQLSRCLTRLGIPLKMRQSGRQNATTWRIKLVLTKTLFGNCDGLVETAKLDQ